METESDGRRFLRALVRLLEGARHDAGGHGQQARTLAYRAFGRQTARPPQLHRPYPEGNSVREGAQAEGQAAQAIRQRAQPASSAHSYDWHCWRLSIALVAQKAFVPVSASQGHSDGDQRQAETGERKACQPWVALTYCAQWK